VNYSDLGYIIYILLVSRKSFWRKRLAIDRPTASLASDRELLRQRWYAEGIFSHLTMADALAAGVADHPDVRMVFHSRRCTNLITIAEVYRASDRAAAAMYALGLRASDVIAVMLPTRSETVIAYHAIFKLGAILVPMVMMMGPAEMRFVLKECKARAVILPQRWRGHDYLARLEQAGPLPDLQHVLIVEADGETINTDWRLAMDNAPPTFPRPSLDPDEACSIIFTSGTTSAPKGVIHTHNTLLAEMSPAAIRLRGSTKPEGTVYLNCWAPGHVGGLLYFTQPFILGTTTVYMNRWDASQAAELIERYRVTATGGTPIFLLSLLEAATSERYDISSLRHFTLGGASITPEHILMARRHGISAGRVYGSTEHPTVTSAFPDAPEPKRIKTDGQISRFNEVRILDDHGTDLPVGMVGEIVTRGPELFIGYLDSRLDQECFLPGGWFRTGDVGRIDEEGYLTITDRKKDIIIRGGENISSKAVEEALEQHPAVLEAAVVAMPDHLLGEKVCAFVRLLPMATLTVDDISAHFAKVGVARQKTPEKIVEVSDFPRTPSGKIKKGALRAKLNASAER
jgi:acyl-coenzyme A synthetase/AMP-(fatty) acid ligase